MVHTIGKLFVHKKQFYFCCCSSPLPLLTSSLRSLPNVALWLLYYLIILFCCLSTLLPAAHDAELSDVVLLAVQLGAHIHCMAGETVLPSPLCFFSHNFSCLRETTHSRTSDNGRKTVSVLVHLSLLPWRANLGFRLSISPLRYSKS